MPLLMIVFNSLMLLLLILLNHQHLPLGETTLQGAILSMKMYFIFSIFSIILGVGFLWFHLVFW